MKVHDILSEGQNTKVILVDFQPAYDNEWSPNYKSALKNAIEYLNRSHSTNVIIFFNGEEVGIEDTSSDVAQHYIEYGLDENLVDNFSFREKSYAFFRSWMDSGIAPGLIIKVIRHMTVTHNNDSRDLEEDEMIDLIGQDNYEKYFNIIEGDPIYLPDINIAEIKSFSGALIGGGGEKECLREIQILMNAFNIKYKAVSSWIY